MDRLLEAAFALAPLLAERLRLPGVADRWRQVFAIDRVALGHREGVLDRVLELAHVAWPAVALERSDRAGGELPVGSETFEEMMREQPDVFSSFAERRQRDRYDRDAVVEVFAEISALHFLGEVAIRRGHDPHIDGDRRRRPDAFERALLQRAQQLHLHRMVELTDLVEEERAAIGRLEAPFAPFGGTRERALLVPEKLALDQLRRNRAAIDGDEGLLGPR